MIEMVVAEVAKIVYTWIEMSCVAYTHVGKGILLLYGVSYRTRFCHSVMLRSITVL